MIAEIEDAIIARLKAKGLQTDDIRSQKGAEGYVRPAVYVATEEGKFERVTSTSGRLTLDIYLTVAFRELRGEQFRRRGIYPLLEGIVGMLAFQSLGLAIGQLMPKGFRNVTDEELADSGVVAFQVAFETSYTVGKMTDEAVTDLLKIGLSYCLKPGDDVKDGEDVVTL